MSRRFVDLRTIRQRMDRKDARFRAVPARAVLRPEVYPYASVEVIRVPAPTPAAPPVEITGDPAVWHAFLAHPATGAHLDAILEDFAAIDAEAAAATARREAERDDDQQGDACSPACGFCGRCS